MLVVLTAGELVVQMALELAGKKDLRKVDYLVEMRDVYLVADLAEMTVVKQVVGLGGL
jgi:hypothetical protein